MADNQQRQSKTESVQARLSSNYYLNKADTDPFPNPTLIDPPEENEAKEVRKAARAMLAVLKVFLKQGSTTSGISS